MSLFGEIRIPGLVDMHVHFREPGFAYKETIKSGSMAAMRAGYSDVFAMPNVCPAPDSLEHLRVQQAIIARDSLIGVHPYASITLGQKGEGELVDIEALSHHVPGFSDDGRGVQDEGLMREAMQRIAAVDSIVVEHCEVNSLGASPESEWREVERNIRLSDETGCRLHVCHISTKESVSLIRDAKASGVKVTCETAPHYLLLNSRMVQDDGCWKMNPPIRDVADQMALLAGINDGTIDVIATDHAPHSAEEKSRGFANSANGIVGIEIAFPLLYTYLVRTGMLTMDHLIKLMCTRAREIMRLEQDSWATFELDTPYVIDPEHFVSKGHSTPFAGWQVYGRCIKNEVRGKIVYEE